MPQCHRPIILASSQMLRHRPWPVSSILSSIRQYHTGFHRLQVASASAFRRNVRIIKPNNFTIDTRRCIHDGRKKDVFLSYSFVPQFYQSTFSLQGKAQYMSRAAFSSHRPEVEKDTQSIPEPIGGFSAMVRRIPRIEWHLSDLVSVLGIGILFVSILVLPSVIE